MIWWTVAHTGSNPVLTTTVRYKFLVVLKYVYYAWGGFH